MHNVLRSRFHVRGIDVYILHPRPPVHHAQAQVGEEGPHAGAFVRGGGAAAAVKTAKRNQHQTVVDAISLLKGGSFLLMSGIFFTFC